ncbi:MAG TPA: hypothetical protein VGK34_04130 [Armatimonadota bacterium]|jgi:hypothetical protein
MISKDYFANISGILPAEQRVKLLEEAGKQWQEDHPADLSVRSISNADEAELQKYSLDEHPSVRKLAIEMLCRTGTSVRWEDLERWVFDPSRTVREAAVVAILEGQGTNALCESYKRRFTAMLTDAAVQYEDGLLGLIMRVLAERGAEWRDLTWEYADSLIEKAGPYLFASLVVGYFERVITDNHWGTDDPHIRPWIEGQNKVRKEILLDVAAYLHLIGGKLHEIVEALSKDSNPDIARDAKTILEYYTANKPPA